VGGRRGDGGRTPWVDDVHVALVTEGEDVFENHSLGSRMGSLLLFGLVIGIVVALVVGVAAPMLDAVDQVGAAGG
jgi:hypothetical protein